MRQPQGTRSSEATNKGTGTPVATSTSNSTPAASASCGCGCHEHAAQSCSCCKLTCFERPKYFCGQLLSDADLTLQETYFREKNKLYHRTIDGFGVVCGLRMSRDISCRGHILIGDGYAIDPCGNDLVVCEPRSLNVIAELRKKNWLVEIPRERVRKDQEDEDLRRRENEEDNCVSRQCFYIGICYSEESIDFSTPYMTECSPAPGPYQPTRVREGVRFEIYDTLPVRSNPLEDTKKRIESCFRIFREGQFSRSLAGMTDSVLEVLHCDQSVDTRQGRSKKLDAQALFKELQAQFLHELRTCPDQYNCDLDREVLRLTPPDQTTDEAGAGVTPLEAFTQLFQLIQKYVFSCVLATLAFSCPEPPDSSCVLIGGVEIENGRLVRVVNYPRWYLWCFANFFEVLLYSMANDGACNKETLANDANSREGGAEKVKTGCCPEEYEVWICQFLNLFSADHRAFEKAASTSIEAIQASYSALVSGFNFTRPGGIAPDVLRNLNRSKAEDLTKMLGLNLEPSTGEKAERRDVFAAIADNTIRFRSETLVYDTDEANGGTGDTISQVNGVVGVPTSALGPYTHSMLTDLLERLTVAETRLSEFESKLEAKGKAQTPPAKN